MQYGGKKISTIVKYSICLYTAILRIFVEIKTSIEGDTYILVMQYRCKKITAIGTAILVYYVKNTRVYEVPKRAIKYNLLN